MSSFQRSVFAAAIILTCSACETLAATFTVLNTNNSGKGSLQVFNGAAMVVQAVNSQAVHAAATMERSVR